MTTGGRIGCRLPVASHTRGSRRKGSIMTVKPWLKQFAAVSLLSAAMVAAAGGCSGQGATVDPFSGEPKDTRVEPLTENQVPADVMKGFRNLAPHAQITRIERRYYFAGGPFYRFYYALQGAPGAGQTIDIDPAPTGA